MEESIESKWREVLACPPQGLEEFVLLAAATPCLRKLYPFQSYDWLCFSDMAGYPQTVRGPRVQPLKIQAEIQTGDQAKGQAKDQIDGQIEVRSYRGGQDIFLAQTDAVQALKLVAEEAEQLFQ